MKFKLIFSTLIAITILFSANIIANNNITKIPISPLLKNSKQLLVVTTNSWQSMHATLQRYYRHSHNQPWQPCGKAISVVVGKKGLGWAINYSKYKLTGPYKKEGDAKAPAGIFSLGSAFGFAQRTSIKTKLPYIHITPSIVCVDDSSSKYYNQIINSADVNPKSWNSGEQMYHYKTSYQYGWVVNYNTHNLIREAGSCIFMHVWKGPDGGTVGCTAMPKKSVKAILEWLNPQDNPVLVQLPKNIYRQLKSAWKLPNFSELRHQLPLQGATIKMTRNLKNQEYANRFSINQLIEETYYEAKKENAYALSMPLIASALQGNKQLYEKILPTMLEALEALESIPTERNSRKAWLLGRVLLAANSINDTITAQRTKTELEKLLTEDNMPKDAFSAWALGYLADSNEHEYTNFKIAMIDAASALTNKFQTEKTSNLSTDAMWAWVMALQAAANAKDQETFDFILHKMKNMTEQSSVSAALSTGLTPNDYPAWAFAIVRLAAATIGNKEIYDELEQPLHDSLETAKQTENKQEFMLAELNAQLAMIQWEKQKHSLSHSFQ